MFCRMIDDQIVMRPIEERYADVLYAVVDANRSYLLPWMRWAEKATLESVKEYYRSSLQRTAANDGFEALIFVQDQPVGAIGFQGVNWQDRVTSIGYWLAEEFQGRGIMTRCCRALVDHAFVEWKLNRVEIRCAVENVRSGRIPRRLGFVEEGVLRQASRVGERYFDLVLYSMLAEEWAGQAKSGS